MMNFNRNMPMADQTTRNVILSTYQIGDSTFAARNDASAMSDRFSKSTVFLGSAAKLVSRVEINSTSGSEKDVLNSEGFVPTLNSRMMTNGATETPRKSVTQDGAAQNPLSRPSNTRLTSAE